MVGDILQPTHLLFILVVALLVLGPKRLPEVGRQLGSGLRDFRAAINGERAEHHDEQPPADGQQPPEQFVSEPVPQPVEEPVVVTGEADVAAPSGAMELGPDRFESAVPEHTGASEHELSLEQPGDASHEVSLEQPADVSHEVSLEQPEPAERQPAPRT